MINNDNYCVLMQDLNLEKGWWNLRVSLIRLD